MFILHPKIYFHRLRVVKVQHYAECESLFSITVKSMFSRSFDVSVKIKLEGRTGQGFTMTSCGRFQSLLVNGNADRFLQVIHSARYRRTFTKYSKR